MQVQDNEISVTNFHNYLLHYKNPVNGKDVTLENLFKKLSGFIDTKTVTVDNLINVTKNLDDDKFIKTIHNPYTNIIKDDTDYIATIRKLSGLLKFYPVSINMTITNDNKVYLFANEHVYQLSSDSISLLNNDPLTAKTLLRYEDMNILYKRKFNVLNGKEGYLINTNLLMLRKCGITLADILTLNRHDDYAFFYLAILSGYKNILNDYIHNIEYISSLTTNPIRRKEIKLTDDALDFILGLDINDLKYPSTRIFVKKVQKVNNKYDRDEAKEVGSNILNSYWRDIDINLIREELNTLELNTLAGSDTIVNTGYIEVLTVGRKDDIIIDKYNGNDHYIKDFLNKLREKLSNAD